MKNNAFIDERGLLYPIEFKHIPFKPKRVFYVTDVPTGIKRGDHAHYETQQLLICVKGKIEVNLFNGNDWVTTILKETECTLVDKLIWDNQIFLEKNSVLLVFCSTEYDKEDYITDIEKFKEIVA